MGKSIIPPEHPLQVGGGIGIEDLAEAGTELAIEDNTADLEQEIGAPAGSLHLLRGCPIEALLI